VRAGFKWAHDALLKEHTPSSPVASAPQFLTIVMCVRVGYVAHSCRRQLATLRSSVKVFLRNIPLESWKLRAGDRRRVLDREWWNEREMEGVGETELFLGDALGAIASKVVTWPPRPRLQCVVCVCVCVCVQ
jgi:hypothetical protein